MKLALQVNQSNIRNYQELISQYNLKLEVTDFAYPHNFGVEAELIVDYWKDHQFRDRISGLHGSFIDLRLHSIDPQIAKISQQRYLWNLGIADQLGIDYTIFHTNYEREQSSNYLKRWIKTHNKLYRKYQTSYNTQIILENSNDTSPIALKVLIEKTEEYKIPVCLDIGHMVANSQIDYQKWFEHLGNNIEVIHLKDIIKPRDELALGHGKVNWEEIFALVDRFCDSPLFVLEVDGIDNISHSLEFLDTRGLL